MSRLSDEEVAWLVDHRPPETKIGSLAREVQEWRTRIRGGPCETCHGSGADFRIEFDNGFDPCPAGCIKGRTPGIIDELEMAASHIAAPCTHPDHRPGRTRKGVRDAVAALREAAES